ncbi:MAG TPA: prepilin-type N-terminal cleavage/methylation domain-containing protein [Actinomycetes bacterium]
MAEASRRRASRSSRQQGFTLIELMVVVLIIAILIAVAIPMFLGARTRALDRAAQTRLRVALTAEKTYYAERQAYTQTAAELLAEEGSLALDAAADANPTKGSIAYALVGNVVVLGTQSGSGTCFYLKDNPTGSGTRYGSDGSAPCPKPSAKEPTITLNQW